MSTNPLKADSNRARQIKSEKGDLLEAAANLFKLLWEFDNEKIKNIAVMKIPNQGLGIAINDRLLRASK